MTVDLRPYDPTTDRSALWRLKRSFELELGGETGDDAKEDRYATKLDDGYRERYLAWVDRCVDDEPGAITLAEADGTPVGYVFVLPDRLAMIWDAAVLNEIYVEPTHRGTGVADELIERAVDVVSDQSLPLSRLVLDVDPDNERASDFYRRHGFETWGELVSLDL
ncbi:GNAT family N-acetyltransferase [Halovivax limisalsi]|uniref:GNAT family N-acetyltransferase n=1 Tax=Halovivax limisalsi TaxID=1453760 RepID=UPI001FFD2CA8|nr:GNAT family N-acetyltransferase [Halovivax limisalsi]